MRTKHLELIGFLLVSLCFSGCQTAPHDSELLGPAAVGDEFPLGTLALDLPSFRTLEDLRASYTHVHESDSFNVFEKDGIKVAVLEVTSHL